MKKQTSLLIFIVILAALFIFIRYQSKIFPSEVSQNVQSTEKFEATDMKVITNLSKSSVPHIDYVSVINADGKMSLLLTGSNFSEKQSVFVRTSDNAAANFYPTYFAKVVITENGTNLLVGPLGIEKGKTYPVAIIHNIDSFNSNGPSPLDSNMVMVQVPVGPTGGMQ